MYVNYKKDKLFTHDKIKNFENFLEVFYFYFGVGSADAYSKTNIILSALPTLLRNK